MRYTILAGALIALSACETYTDKTSPCFGKTDKLVVSQNAFSLLASPDDARAAQVTSCAFRPIGTPQ